jgi:glyoxylase-like metal-dependent hydrolase (beta-lactamase superfamily II)
MDLFQSVQISRHITRIDTPFYVSMYLVKGSSRAALIDTGMGVGSLKEYVSSLTSLPLNVYLTHGHCDHAGGASEFETVYLNRRDWELEKQHATREHRIHDVFTGPGPVPEGVSEEMFVPQRTAPYLPLDDDAEADLGGVHIRFIPVPGHTRGILVPLIVEDRILIIGDALGEHTLLQFAESTSIETYRASLCRLQEHASEFDRLLRFHGSCESKNEIIPDSIELCDAILARKDEAIPVEVHESSGLMARKEQHPGKEGNIIYNPQHIYHARASE